MQAPGQGVSSPLEQRFQAFRIRGLAMLIDDAVAPSRAALVSSARALTEPVLNESLTLARGHTYVTLTADAAEAFLLPLMADTRGGQGVTHEVTTTPEQYVSVEARELVSTGISVKDRCHTIRILGEEVPQPRKLVRPGHVFPVRVSSGGVLIRHSLVEGARDLVKLSCQHEVAVLHELLTPRGELYSGAELETVAERHMLPHFFLSEIVRHRLGTEQLVVRVAEAEIPTTHAGVVHSIVYRSLIHSGEHVALVKGTLSGTEPVLVRMQPEFTAADVFGGSTPPTRVQIENSLRAIGTRGRGVLVYLRRTSRGELPAQIHHWEARYQEKPASIMRQYGVGAQILRDLGVTKIELLTGSKKILAGLNTFGIDIVKQHSLDEVQLPTPVPTPEYQVQNSLAVNS